MMAAALVGLKFADTKGSEDVFVVLETFGSWGRASREMVSVKDLDMAFLVKLTRKLQ